VTTLLSEAATQSLEERLIAWFTSLRSDGSPHTTPAWFIFDENFIWIASGQRNRKVANVLGDPRVILDGLARKYDGWDARDNSIDGERVLLKISIDRWLLGA